VKVHRLVQLIVLAAIALALVPGTAPAGPAGLAAPHALSPANGATFPSLPAFGWSGVAKAQHYEIQISADPSFNSPVLGGGQDRFTTSNTRATLLHQIPNGTYWWHVRAITQNGDVGPWSASRSVRRAWTTAPRPISPANGAPVNYGRSTLTLRWTPVPLAARYLVSLATDPQLSNLVGGGPVETSATTFTPSVVLAVGKSYYWAVQPEDAQNNRGTQSAVVSFKWNWPSTITPHYGDLVSALEFVDPQLSWNAIPGAAHYDVEINSDRDWAPGSKVCCDNGAVGTSLSPTNVLKNNTYYWRVRAVDVDGDAGTWYPQALTSFVKTFDNVPPVAGTSIQGLHMRDNERDTGSSPPGFSTSSPVVVWNAVPGASSYEVEVSPVLSGACAWQQAWQATTAVTAWTPLNSGQQAPYPAHIGVSQDNNELVAGTTYCVRVRARGDRASGSEVFGDYTYLNNAFTFAGYPSWCQCAVSANPGVYIAPVEGQVAQQTPLFTWHAIPGAGSYYVIVSKDPSFTNVVDYAFTRIPAYAPRDGQGPRTYSDETTLYYWAVLPSGFQDGLGAQGDPLHQADSLVPNGRVKFKKQSVPPTISAPAANSNLVGPPTFRWNPVTGARDYRIQVSQDKNFGTLLDDQVTDSTAYTSTKTYPANTALYARVRAEDETQIGLTWSPVKTFRNLLPAPVPNGRPSSGDQLPTFTWRPVPLAVAYDVHIEAPDASKHDVGNLRSPALTPTSMGGTGVFHWQVRAEFPQAGGGTVPGPYSRLVPFTRIIRPPVGAHLVGGANSVLYVWQPKLGARSYRIEVARSPDFSSGVDNQQVDTAKYAPNLDNYRDGGRYYWHVQAIDADGNTGDFSPTLSFTLPKRKR
jgi:hypothetical protein